MKITFCGHAKEVYGKDIIKKLHTVLTEKIQFGAKIFYLGGYGKFDYICAKTLKKLKATYPHIKIILVTPYINKPFDTQIYDESIYPSLENIPLRFAISHRNRWMVDNSDCVICYVKHGWGGAFKTLEYAKKRKKEIIELQ